VYEAEAAAIFTVQLLENTSLRLLS